MNKESYLFDRIRWGAAIFLIFHISLLFILFLQDWKTEKMKWFILFLGVLYVILLYAAYLPAFKSEQPDKGGFCQRGQL